MDGSRTELLPPPTPAPPGSSSTPGRALGETRPPPSIPDHELLHPIGHGAYGEVWLARSALGTLRAVKVLCRHDFGEPQPFEREFKGIQRYEPVSRTHGGLVDILQVGRHDADGCFYYVMELADAVMEPNPDKAPGKGPANPGPSASSSSLPPASPGAYVPRTLRHELVSRGRLPFDECLDLGLALSDALEHLHQHGLVHRDIKPSNIIFVHGRPKLADLGLVAGVEEARSFVGTEGFIPPEGPGRPQADLYSLGIVLYVMSTGNRHDAFPEPRADLASDPDQVRWLELNAIIHRACHADPRRRYATASEMKADLERLREGRSVRRQQRAAAGWRMARLAGALAAAVVAVATTFHAWTERLARRPDPTPALPAERASVFVLPFRSDGTPAAPSDLCDRVTDAFIDALAVIEGVRRSPRRSGWVHQDEEALRRSLARTNGLRHILTGRIGGTGDTLTLALSLYERGIDRTVWSGSFAAPTNAIPDLERHGLVALASALGLRITEVEQRHIDRLLANNLEAMTWLRKAQQLYDDKAGTPAAYAEVQTEAQRALTFDPGYLDAEFLDIVVLRDLALGRAAQEMWPGIRMRVERILEVDPTHMGALDFLGGYLLSFARDWEALSANVERELASRDPHSRDFAGAMWYRSLGWFEEARVCQERSEKPQPTHWVPLFHMVAARRVDRRFAEGAEIARRMRRLYPDNPWACLMLAHCLVESGEFEAGLEAIRQAGASHSHELTALKGYAHARMGQPGQAREVLAGLMELSASGHYVPPYFVARVHAALGDHRQALDWLWKAEADKSEHLMFPDVGGLRTDPAWDGLQTEPRYWQLCERLGLGRNQWPRPKPDVPR